MEPKCEFRLVRENELYNVQGGGILRDIVKAVGKVVNYVRDRITKRPGIRPL
jgi:hypothetical protein